MFILHNSTKINNYFLGIFYRVCYACFTRAIITFVKRQIMKYVGLLAMLFFMTGTISCQNSKQKKVPKAVEKSFAKQYPGENDPDWEIDAHGFWEAHFKKKGIHYRADYKPNGDWVETENSITYKELPKSIQIAINRDYSTYKIAEVEHVTNAEKGEFYDVEFKQKGKNKDVEYRADGSEL